MLAFQFVYKSEKEGYMRKKGAINIQYSAWWFAEMVGIFVAYFLTAAFGFVRKTAVVSVISMDENKRRGGKGPE